MSILISNSVINRKGTPCIISDVFANRPLATSLQLGSIYFSTDTNNIYQVVPFGSTQAWATMGGGGGGTQNLDNVLYQGGTFTNDRLSNLGGYGWELYNFDYFELQNINNQLWRFTDTSLKYYNSTNTNTFFSLNYTTGEFAMGDFGGTINGTHMNINVAGHNIYFAPDGLLTLMVETGVCTLGDFQGVVNGTRLITNVYNQLINTYIGGVENGIRLEADYLGSGFPNFKFGDFEGLYDGGYININNYAIQTYNAGIVYGFEISVGDGWCIFGDVQNTSFGGKLFIYNSADPYSYLNCKDTYSEWGFKVKFVSATEENPDYYTATIGDWATYAGNLGACIETYYSAGETYIKFWNSNRIEFSNCSIVSGSAGGSSGDHLIIYIDGTQYKIALLNP